MLVLSGVASYLCCSDERLLSNTDVLPSSGMRERSDSCYATHTTEQYPAVRRYDRYMRWCAHAAIDGQLIFPNPSDPSTVDDQLAGALGVPSSEAYMMMRK